MILISRSNGFPSLAFGQLGVQFQVIRDTSLRQDNEGGTYYLLIIEVEGGIDIYGSVESGAELETDP